MIATDLLTQYIDTRWLYTLRIGGTALLIGYFWSFYTELRLVKKLNIPTLIIAIMIGLIVFILWISLNQNWMSFAKSPEMINVSAHLNTTMIVIRMIGAAIVVPIMEELFWRSFIMRWIDQAEFLQVSPIVVSVKALLISSLLFASEHIFWFAGLLAGLIYAYLYMRTQNLWYSIIAHGITNLTLGMWVVNTEQWQYW